MNGLSLPRLGAYFIHQEWKLPSGKKVDLLGIEPRQGRLVVVELKASEKDARHVDARTGGTAWHRRDPAPPPPTRHEEAAGGLSRSSTTPTTTQWCESGVMALPTSHDPPLFSRAQAPAS